MNIARAAVYTVDWIIPPPPHPSISAFIWINSMKGGKRIPYLSKRIEKKDKGRIEKKKAK